MPSRATSMAERLPGVVCRCASRAICCALLAGLLASPVAPLQAQSPVVAELNITQPRPFGYVLGDIVERDVTLALQLPYTLDPTAPTAPPPANFWLERLEPQISVVHGPRTTTYTIAFRYQVTNFDPGITDVPVSHENLLYHEPNGNTGQILVPAARVNLLPLLSQSAAEPQPNDRPQPRSFEPTRALGWGLLLAGALLALAQLNFDLFTPSAVRPFRRACKQLRRLRAGTRASDYENALRVVHAAFNLTAGRTVFMESLERFFTEHARFVSEREPIEHFFSASRRFFYEQATAERAEIGALETLCRRCRDLERGTG